jgi:hypothetical protein
VRDQLAGKLGRRDVVLGDQIADTVAGVDACPAKLIHRDVLPHHLLDDAGPGEKEARALHHHHEVGERRRVGPSSRGGPGDHADLRHPP